MADAYGACRISMLFITAGKLSKGSPIPIYTMFVSRSLSSTDSTWLIISPALRLPLNPMPPVAQNLQPILHPACEDMHNVALSFSGIYTLSTKPWRAANKYFLLPSADLLVFMAADKPMTQRSANISRPFCEMSLMALKSLHLFTYIHLANCLAVNRGSRRFSTTISNS